VSQFTQQVILGLLLGGVYVAVALGFSLVWLNDKDGNLWMCDADDGGKVYSYAMVTSDLLDGDGPDMIGLQLASDGTYDGMPQDIAEKVCAAYLTDGGKVLASASDGLETDPGFIVFVGDKAGKYYFCNATADAAVWAFAPIGDPLTFPEQQS
jgi:sugar lactone lactonase YvrE